MKKFFNKRNTLISLVLIAILVSVAAFAWFSDQEKSTGNTVTAGTLNLTVDGKENTQVMHLTFNNVVPADQWHGAEYDYQWVIKNTGTIPGSVTYKIVNIVNNENGVNDPELKAGDDPASTLGELGSQFKVLFQLNQAPYGYSQEIYPLNSGEGVEYTPAAYHLDPGQSANVYIRSWLINGPLNNLAQGDSVSFDVVFTLNQDH